MLLYKLETAYMTQSHTKQLLTTVTTITDLNSLTIK